MNVKNNEKEVARIYGINPKTLHRWITKGLKKNQGKYIYLNIIGVRRWKKNQRTGDGSKTTRMV